MTIIVLLDDNFKPVPLELATKAKVLKDPKYPMPYFIEITPDWKPPEGVTILDGTQEEEE